MSKSYSMDVYHSSARQVLGTILQVAPQCWLARTTEGSLGAFRSKKNAIAAVYRAKLRKAQP